MSKYQPLEAFLAGRFDRELPMTFAEVETLLGFALPPSARAHPQWWSNNVGSHVAVKAWRDAGWRTSRVDVGGERVVFMRDMPAAASSASPLIFEPEHQDIPLRWSGLNLAVKKLIVETEEAAHCTPEEAVGRLLTEVVLERRKRILEWFAANATKVDNPSNSVDLIREDRDRDEY